MNKLLYGISHMEYEDYEFALDCIKKSGYDFVALHWYRNGAERVHTNQYKMLEYCRKINLNVNDIHLDFNGCNEFWSPLENNTYIEFIIKAIKECASLNLFNLVFHISSSNNPPPMNENGIENLKTIVKVAEEYGVTLLMENLRRVDYFDYLMQNVKSPNLKVCFDAGHANLYMKDIDGFFEKYHSIIVTTHLHDNYGDYDSHRSLNSGSIDWRYIFSKLSMCENLYSLHLEVFPAQENLSHLVVRECTEQNLEDLKKMKNEFLKN